MSILYSRSALDYMQIDVRYVDTIQVGSTYRKRLEYLIHGRNRRDRRFEK